MAQTPCLRAGSTEFVKYTPGSAVIAGQVVVVGQTVMIAPAAIAASAEGDLCSEGRWDVPASTEAWSQGDELFWNSTGDPVGGDAGSGCFTNVGGGSVFAGYAAKAKASGLGKGKLNLTPGRSRRVPTKTVAATGSAQGDAAALAEGFNFVTGADGTKGVILPTPYDGMVVTVKNRDSDNAILKVYPTTGKAVNALSANAAISLAVKVPARFTYLDSTGIWYTEPLLPS